MTARRLLSLWTITGLVLVGLAAAHGVRAEQADSRGALAEAWVEAFNSGDVEVMMAFYKEHGSGGKDGSRNESRDRRLYDMLRRDLGTLDVQGIDIDGSGRVRLVTQPEKKPGMRAVFEMQMEGEPPLLGAFRASLEAGDSPEVGLPPLEVSPDASMTEVAAALESYFADLAEQGLFSGTVLVSRRGDTLYSGAFGLANREKAIPNRMQTSFDVGSITKAMTKVAIGQLARDGKLSLEDTIADLMPDYPNKEVARQVTVQQLLEHASGLGDIFNERFDAMDKAKLRHPRDFFPLFVDEPLRFTPGESSRYSNAGYVVLGAIIETVSKQPYEKYMERNVFRPADMQKSGFFVRDGKRADLAIGYTSRDEHAGSGSRHGGGDHEAREHRGSEDSAQRWQPNIGQLPIQGCPAGSSSHTAEDLVRFDTALRNGTLLGPGWTEWYFTRSVPTGATGKVSEAFWIDHGIGIAGGGPGVNASLESGGDTALVILSNLDPPSAQHVARRLRQVSQLGLD